MPTRRAFGSPLLQDAEAGGINKVEMMGEPGFEPDPGVDPNYSIPDEMLRDPIMGSRDSARELFKNPTPATMATLPPPPEGYQIPQGVTVDPQRTNFAPSTPSAPTPVAAQTGSPMAATEPAQAAAAGPRRVSPLISSALFPEARGGGLMGQAGGLLGGGVGVPGGAQRGGTPDPTAQMLALLRALSGGA